MVTLRAGGWCVSLVMVDASGEFVHTGLTEVTSSPTDSTLALSGRPADGGGNGAYDSSAFMSEDRWKDTLKCEKSSISQTRGFKSICTRNTSGSRPLRLYSSVWQIPSQPLSVPGMDARSRVSRTREQDPHPNFVRPRGCYLHFFHPQGLTSCPGYRSLASNCFPDCRHCNLKVQVQVQMSRWSRGAFFVLNFILSYHP
jgi:hypothetical protein